MVLPVLSGWQYKGQVTKRIPVERQYWFPSSLNVHYLSSHIAFSQPKIKQAKTQCDNLHQGSQVSQSLN